MQYVDAQQKSRQGQVKLSASLWLRRRGRNRRRFADDESGSEGAIEDTIVCRFPWKISVSLKGTNREAGGGVERSTRSREINSEEWTHKILPMLEYSSVYPFKSTVPPQLTEPFVHRFPAVKVQNGRAPFVGDLGGAGTTCRCGSVSELQFSA